MMTKLEYQTKSTSLLSNSNQEIKITKSSPTPQIHRKSINKYQEPLYFSCRRVPYILVWEIYYTRFLFVEIKIPPISKLKKARLVFEGRENTERERGFVQLLPSLDCVRDEEEDDMLERYRRLHHRLHGCHLSFLRSCSYLAVVLKELVMAMDEPMAA